MVRARLRLRKSRLTDPKDILSNLGIDPSHALDGFDRWRPDLVDSISRVKAAGGEQGGISFEDGLILYGVARALRPGIVVETGVAAGISTAFFAAAMIENGDGLLYSIELPPRQVQGNTQADGVLFDWPKYGVGWAIPPGIREALGHRHVLLLEDVRTCLPRILSQLSPIDVFFHDDLHAPDHMLWEYRSVWPFLRAGGLLASDDVNEGWIEFCKEHGFGESALFNMQRLAAVAKPA